MSTHTIKYQGIELEYELVRKNVKYINLRVNKKGEVVVSAPIQAPFLIIDEFVGSKALWIITHLAEIEQLKYNAPDKGFYDGKTLYYLGNLYTLVISIGEFSISLKESKLYFSTLKTTQTEQHEEYIAWLKNQATKKFQEILDGVFPLLKEYRIPYPTIQVRNMRTIWGSCSRHTQTIRLNLQLMKSPEECIEQVIIHELVHFVHSNHSQRFYGLLEHILPDYKERKQHLESNYKDGL